MVVWLCFCFDGDVFVALWWCGCVFVLVLFLFGGVFLWWWFCEGVVVFLCGVVVFLFWWWCFSGGVFVRKCCREVLEKSVVEKCCREVMEKSVEECEKNCWRRVS